MKINKTVIIVGVLVLALAVGIWFFRTESAVVPDIPDPYEVLREDVGPWTGPEDNNSMGVVIWNSILEIPDPGQKERDRLKNAALAFFKGYNLKANGWTAKSVLPNDVAEFVTQNPNIHHRNVRVGQFI